MRLRVGPSALRPLLMGLALTAGLLGLGARAHAVGPPAFDLPGKGPWEAWQQKKGPIVPPAENTVRTQRDFVELGDDIVDDDLLVVIVDQKRGRIAIRPEPEAWKNPKFTEADFRRYDAVKVRVTSGGERVAAATIDFRHKGGTETQVLDPKANGEAVFRAIEPGSVTVKVLFRRGDATAPPVTQVFDLPADGDEKYPVLEVGLPGEVATVGAADRDEGEASADAKGDSRPEGDEPAAPPASAEPASKAAQASGPNPLGQAIVYLVALGVAGGLAYLAVQAARKNPKVVTNTLEQLGVQIPKPDDAPLTDPGPAPAPAKAAPPEKILLGDAPVAVTASDPIAPVGTSTVTGIPRLVGESGRVVSPEEGETSVGRDDENGLSLAGESTVSRRHAVLLRSGNALRVRDLGSTNGTFVNGQRVADEVGLRVGDVVQFGAIRFRVEG